MAKSVCPGYCPSPFCVLACPAKVMFVGEDGNIQIDFDKCHGCGICRVVCLTFSRDRNLEKKMPWLSVRRA